MVYISVGASPCVKMHMNVCVHLWRPLVDISVSSFPVPHLHIEIESFNWTENLTTLLAAILTYQLALGIWCLCFLRVFKLQLGLGEMVSRNLRIQSPVLPLPLKVL